MWRTRRNLGQEGNELTVSVPVRLTSNSKLSPRQEELGATFPVRFFSTGWNSISVSIGAQRWCMREPLSLAGLVSALRVNVTRSQLSNDLRRCISFRIRANF